ncbi:hypothetical protein D3C86_1422630 [compost metagenome]
MGQRSRGEVSFVGRDHRVRRSAHAEPARPHAASPRRRHAQRRRVGLASVAAPSRHPLEHALDDGRGRPARHAPGPRASRRHSQGHRVRPLGRACGVPHPQAPPGRCVRVRLLWHDARGAAHGMGSHSCIHRVGSSSCHPPARQGTHRPIARQARRHGRHARIPHGRQVRGERVAGQPCELARCRVPRVGPRSELGGRSVWRQPARAVECVSGADPQHPPAQGRGGHSAAGRRATLQLHARPPESSLRGLHAGVAATHRRRHEFAL